MVALIRRRRVIRFAIIAAVTVVAVLAAAAPADAGDAAEPSFFASREVRLTDVRRFTKWTTVLARYAVERTAANARPCLEADSVACQYRRWNQFLDGLRESSRWQQLVAVNRFMNARPYQTDERIWGTSDHWSTPGEFLTRAGDCEDYAIAKYLSLKRLGWTDAQLRLVAVKDRRLGLGHAVLIAVLDGKTWVLDNQRTAVTATEAVRNYRPVYSINATAWWLHHAAERA